MPDLFSTSQEFFDLGGGDYEEHAILLANYFSYIDQKQGKDFKSFLVLGAGMPNGHMVYVMRKRTI
jgi:coiled-coil and C2 domain-containing protein 2A